MRVAIIDNAGFATGGVLKLLKEYSKLGISCYIRNTIIHSCAYDETIPVYNSIDDLCEIVSNYDRIIVCDLWYGSTCPDYALDFLLVLRKKFPNLEICFLYCSRHFTVHKELSSVCKKINFRFDKIFTLNPQLSSVVSSNGEVIVYTKDICTTRINAYTPNCTMPVYEDKNNIVFTAGRCESFKGILKFFKSITSKFTNSEFTYVHYGATFNKHKSDDGISCPPQLLCLFDMDKKPKKLKPQFNMCFSYNDLPESDKFNVYPQYNPSTIESMWKNNFAGICCILGTKNKIVCSNSLLNTTYTVDDKRENTQLHNELCRWNADLEYADIEKLELGIPVLFSKAYANIIGFCDNRLIYNSFDEIPDKLQLLKNCYADAVRSQQEWFHSHMLNVNKHIYNTFVGE